MGIILSVIGFLLSVCAAAFVVFKVENGSDSPLYYLFILICIATLIYICITIIKYMKNGNEPRDTKKEEKREPEESKEWNDITSDYGIKDNTYIENDTPDVSFISDDCDQKQSGPKRSEANGKEVVKKASVRTSIIYHRKGSCPDLHYMADCSIKKVNQDTYVINCCTYGSGQDPGIAASGTITKDYIMQHTFEQFCKEHSFLDNAMNEFVGCGTMQDLWETMVADLTRESAQALASALSQHVNGENGQ